MGFGIIDLLAGITRIIRENVGKSKRDWALFAEEHPKAASYALDRAAGMLEARGLSRRRRRSGRLPWLARRQLNTAGRLRQQARDLRMWADEGSCPRDQLRKPGT